MAEQEAPSNQLPAIGTLLGGRFEREKRLGVGGMGAVYRAKDSRLRRSVAIKLILPRFAADPEFSQRFLREAEAAAQVRHRNVVAIIDSGEAKEGVYLVMEYLEGQDLIDPLILDEVAA